MSIPPPRHILHVLVLLVVAALHCDTAQNPRSLWINYSQREIDLQLVDFEPPPF
jgi:hypothetical protein